ncbi:MAG: four helix bundle protein [Proteobacteria bacterium]|nr:four helix bundle protein [Pseudomonadota bacterium]
MRKHHELKAWQEAMELVKEIYRVTRDFPKEEIYGLVSQMRRAAVSIPSNISEGAARGGDREFIQFLIIARGSLSELETQLLISKDLGYLTPHSSPLTPYPGVPDIQERIDKLFSLIGGLLRSLRERGNTKNA